LNEAATENPTGESNFVRAKQDPLYAAHELELQKLAFEREKWKDDLRLREEDIKIRRADLGRHDGRALSS
jgi:hypothetical protein